jgi:hypothetical protein
MPKDNSKPQRERRAREAQERQAERNARGDQGQLARLTDGLHNAARERARLYKRIDAA